MTGHVAGSFEIMVILVENGSGWTMNLVRRMVLRYIPLSNARIAAMRSRDDAWCPFPSWLTRGKINPGAELSIISNTGVGDLYTRGEVAAASRPSSFFRALS